MSRCQCGQFGRQRILQESPTPPRRDCDSNKHTHTHTHTKDTQTHTKYTKYTQNTTILRCECVEMQLA